MSQALSNYDAVQESAGEVEAVLRKEPTLTAIFVRRAGTHELVAINDFAKVVQNAASANGRNSPATTTSVLEDIVSQHGNKGEDSKVGTQLCSGDRAIFVAAPAAARTLG